MTGLQFENMSAWLKANKYLPGLADGRNIITFLIVDIRAEGGWFSFPSGRNQYGDPCLRMILNLYNGTGVGATLRDVLSKPTLFVASFGSMATSFSSYAFR